MRRDGSSNYLWSKSATIRPEYNIPSHAYYNLFDSYNTSSSNHTERYHAFPIRCLAY